MTIRVLVSDDHEVVRTGLATFVSNKDVLCVGEASSVAETIAQVEKLKPDVLLLDVRLGEEDGLSALEEIRARSLDVAVIILSTYDNPTYVARTIALGGNDYLLKDTGRAELLDAIERAASKRPVHEDSLMRRIQATMQKRKDRVDSKEVPLTNRELQVLRHMALGLSNKEIGTSLAISVETVKEHVQNILRKLDSADRTAAAVWAVKSGLLKV